MTRALSGRQPLCCYNVPALLNGFEDNAAFDVPFPEEILQQKETTIPYTAEMALARRSLLKLLLQSSVQQWGALIASRCSCRKVAAVDALLEIASSPKRNGSVGEGSMAVFGETIRDCDHLSLRTEVYTLEHCMGKPRDGLRKSQRRCPVISLFVMLSGTGGRNNPVSGPSAIRPLYHGRCSDRL